MQRGVQCVSKEGRSKKKKKREDLYPPIKKKNYQMIGKKLVVISSRENWAGAGLETDFLKIHFEAFLVIQWLRVHTSHAGYMGSIPCQGTKTPHDTQWDQKKNFLMSFMPLSSLLMHKQCPNFASETQTPLPSGHLPAACLSHSSASWFQLKSQAPDSGPWQVGCLVAFSLTRQTVLTSFVWGEN